jgi:putative flippase GtrA
MRRITGEMIGYAAASACALMVDIIMLAVLVRFLSWWYLAAASVSFVLGLVVAYVISTNFVFSHRRLQSRRIEFFSFAAIGALGLAVNATVIFAAVKYLGMNYLVAKCVAAGFTFICNFISRRQLLFVQPSSA